MQQLSVAPLLITGVKSSFQCVSQTSPGFSVLYIKVFLLLIYRGLYCIHDLYIKRNHIFFLTKQKAVLRLLHCTRVYATDMSTNKKVMWIFFHPLKAISVLCLFICIYYNIITVGVCKPSVPSLLPLALNKRVPTHKYNLSLWITCQ